MPDRRKLRRGETVETSAPGGTGDRGGRAPTPPSGSSRGSLTRSHTVHQDLSQDPATPDRPDPTPIHCSEPPPDPSCDQPPDPAQVNGDVGEALDDEELRPRANGTAEMESGFKEMDDL